MYIRVKTTPNSPRKSIQIVESIRDGGKVKQKIVRYVGIAHDEREEKQLKDYGETLIVKIVGEREQNSPQLSLFPHASEEEVLSHLKIKAGRPKRKNIEDILPPSQVTLDDIVEKERIVEGVHDIAGTLFDEMYAGLFKGKRTYNLLRDVVLCRLVYPSSKRNISHKLTEHFGKDHSVEMIYWMMDKLFPKIDAVKKRTFEKTQELFPEKIDLLLFDVTTLYFESTNVDELRNFGYSKDHRFNTTQVVLALATNQNGLPIGYELFEGNRAEVTTLVAAIESWKKLFCIDSVCFIGDRAMFSRQNIQLLEEKKYQYIIAAKLKTLSDTLQEKLFEEECYQPRQIGDNLGWVANFPHTLCHCSLLMLPEIPEKERIEGILGEALYAYAFIGNRFYYLNRPEKTCIDLLVSEGKIQELKKTFKVSAKQLSLELITHIKKELKEKDLNNIYQMTSHCPGSRLIVSYKSSRAHKDQKDRQQILNKVKKIIGEGGNPNKLITNTGVKKFITQDENASIHLDENKVDAASQWDGLHGIITNIMDDSPESCILRYARLWVIEESFRINKHTLKMRPIYHWAPNRIHAHIAICYMAFSVLRHLQYRVNLTQKISIDEILNELLNVQASIYTHKTTKDQYRVPGRYSNNARKIYKAFNIERSLDATIHIS